MGDMFDWAGGQAKVKPWLREGIRWHLGDACDNLKLFVPWGLKTWSSRVTFSVTWSRRMRRSACETWQAW